MNILLIAPQPFLEKRGTPLAVLQLLKALGELGHRIDLVSYHLGDDIALPGVRHCRALHLPFIRRVAKGMSATKLFLDIFVFIQAVRLLLSNRYDCIHGVEEGAIMGGVLTLFWRVPLLYDMDSSIPEQLQESGSRIWSGLVPVGLAKALEGWTISRAAAVLPVCKSLAERVRSLSPVKPLQLLEDIPNVEQFTAGQLVNLARLRQELGLAGKKIVLYTGTFEGYQGIDLFLEAIPLVVETFPETAFVLVGGEPGQVEEKKSLVASMGVAGQVLVLGKRPLEEMPLFMEMADILASPRNKGTNTPMKIYTYLQSGRPVVATRLPTHTQVLTDDVSVLVAPTAADFAQGVKRLLADPGWGAALGRAGAQLIRDHYSFAGFKNKVGEAYRLIQS